MQCYKAFGSFPFAKGCDRSSYPERQYQHPGHRLQLDVNQKGKLLPPHAHPRHASGEVILIVATERSHPEIYIALTDPAVRNKAIASKEVSPPCVSAKAPWSHEDSHFLSAVEGHAWGTLQDQSPLWTPFSCQSCSILKNKLWSAAVEDQCIKHGENSFLLEILAPSVF